ncbi:hypothetical protein KCU81_g2875, partial [Aureobasidium melanogenum]|uniref:C2H2-type domain-containing protein n=1 Tax=Aureobasidium melanogenum (strain CBS 110374) TaxID=1043003 RepID=A0A074VGF9_AURM1
MSANHSTAQPQHGVINPARQQELSGLKESIQAATNLARKNGTRIIMRDFEMPPEWMSPEMREAVSPFGLTGLLYDHDDVPDRRVDTDDTQVQNYRGLDDYLLDIGQNEFSSMEADNDIMEDTSPDMAMSDIEEEALNLEEALLASKVSTTEAASIGNGREPSPQDEEPNAYDTDEMESSDPDQDPEMDDNFFFGDEDDDDDVFFGDGNGHNDQGDDGKAQAGDEGRDEGGDQGDSKGKAEVTHRSPDDFDFDKEKSDLERRFDLGERQLVVPMQDIFDYVEVVCMERGLSSDQAHTIRFSDKGVDMNLPETLPIARTYDDPRSWMIDNMVEHLVEENGPYPPGTAYITTGMNPLYLGTGRFLTPDEINNQLKEHVRQARSDVNYVPLGIWPFNRTAFNVRKAVMAWNPRGNHWVCVSFFFDEASSKGRVEVRNSRRPPRGANGEFVGTDKMAITYLRAFGELMAISPHVNLPYLTWNEPVQLVEQTEQSNQIDCGPIAVDTIVKELHGQPQTIVRGFAEARAFGLDLRTQILKSVYEKILDRKMPVYYDSPPATGRETAKQTYDFDADEVMAINPEWLQEQGVLLKIAAMEKNPRGESNPGPKVSPVLPGSRAGNNDGDSDSDIEEIEKAADGSFKPVSAKSTKISRKNHDERFELTQRLFKAVQSSKNSSNYSKPLGRLLDRIRLYPSIEASWILGFEQMCRFLPPTRSKYEVLKSGWYSESMVNAIVTLTKSPDSVSHFIPVPDVQTIIGDDAHERFMRYVESGSTDPYPRMASLSQAPKNVDSVVFAWLALGHWTTVYLQRPQSGTVGQILHLDSFGAGKGRARPLLPVKVLPAFVAEYARKLAWPEVRWEVQPGISSEQKDSSSCGPIAIENCVDLLVHGAVNTEPKDANALRLRHFQLAYKAIADTPDPIASQASREDDAASGQKNSNYRELLCNALEHGDDLFDRRLSYYLSSTPTTFVEKSGKWSLIQGPGHNLSTNERLRLESLESPSRVLDVLDYLDNKYSLIIVVMRTSRGYKTRATSDQSKNRALRVAHAFWLRFVSSTASLRRVKHHQDWAAIDHVSELPFFELVLDSVSSSGTLLYMIQSNRELLDILDSVQGRVVMLQANPDGSSTDLASFSEVLTKWPRTNLDLMIYTSTYQESLLNWGVPDNEILWYQLNLNRLVTLWQGQAGDTLSMQERLINNGHEQMLYLMHTMHCAKVDFYKEASVLRCSPWLSNGIAILFMSRRSYDELPEETKSCEECKSETTTVKWRRGSSVNVSPTLRCDESHMSSPRAVADVVSCGGGMYTLKDTSTKPRKSTATKSRKPAKLHKSFKPNRPRRSTRPRKLNVRALRAEEDVPANLVAATPRSKSLIENPAYSLVVRNKDWQSGVTHISIGGKLLPHTAGMFIRRRISRLERDSSPPSMNVRINRRSALWVCEPCGREGFSFEDMGCHYLSHGHLAVVSQQTEVIIDPRQWMALAEAQLPYFGAGSRHYKLNPECLMIDGKPHVLIFICDLCGTSNSRFTAMRRHMKNCHHVDIGGVRSLNHRSSNVQEAGDDDRVEADDKAATEAFAAIVEKFEIFRTKYESDKGADK